MSDPGFSPAPQGAVEPTAQHTSAVVFDHIPELIELMPKTGGQPGITYSQILVDHLRTAQDEGWSLIQGADFYVIEGPNGQASVALVGKGQIIPGIDPHSGKCECLVDVAVRTITGLKISQAHEDSLTAPKAEEPKAGKPLAKKDPVSAASALSPKDT